MAVSVSTAGLAALIAGYALTLVSTTSRVITDQPSKEQQSEFNGEIFKAIDEDFNCYKKLENCLIEAKDFDIEFELKLRNGIREYRVHGVADLRHLLHSVIPPLNSLSPTNDQEIPLVENFKQLLRRVQADPSVHQTSIASIGDTMIEIMKSLLASSSGVAEIRGLVQAITTKSVGKLLNSIPEMICRLPPRAVDEILASPANPTNLDDSTYTQISPELIDKIVASVNDRSFGSDLKLILKYHDINTDGDSEHSPLLDGEPGEIWV